MTPQTPSDENLPEVVPNPRTLETITDSSLQVTPSEKVDLYDFQTAKYPVIYDATPKLPDDELPTDKIPFDAAYSPSATSPSTLKPWDSLPAGSPESNDPPSTPPPRCICGLRRRTFFITLGIVLLVIIAATIGGAVGATRQTSSPSTPVALTLNNSTAPHPGFAFQSFSGTNFTGLPSPILQSEGFHDLPPSLSYVWLPSTTECCVTFCQDKTTATGWWCNARYRTEASGIFGRVYIWCGGWREGRNETCA